MIKLKDLLFEEGCSNCSRPKAPLLTESTNPERLSEHILYHVYNKLPLVENTFRYNSEAFLNLWQEARWLHTNNQIKFDGIDEEILKETDLGKFDFYEGHLVPLDLLLEYEDAEAAGINNISDEPISEKTDKKHPALGKPKRGGAKKFYVYVKDPKTKRIKKVSFGMAGGGLRAKLNNPKARKAFAARHKCAQAKDRTTARYWSCRLPRYSKLLGFKTTFSGYW
jgi:hypothetical protein